MNNQQTFNNPWCEDEDDKVLPQGTIEIFKYVAESLSKRADDNYVLRASEASNCVKKRWFKYHKYPSDPLNPRAILVFALGDLVEHLLKAFIADACVGPNRLYSEVNFGEVMDEFSVQGKSFPVYEQPEIKTIIYDLEITSHPDGFGRRNSDGMWELIEIKSSATGSFDQFKRGQMPDYIRQAHTIMMSEDHDVKSVRFFYMNKNTSHVFDRLYWYDEEIAETVRREFKISIGKVEPAVPDGFGFKETKDGIRVLENWRCSYCGFVKACKPGIKRVFTKAGKPVWIMD